MTGALASLPALSASGWIDAAVLGLLVLAALLGAVRGLGGEVGRILALAAGLAVLAVLHGPVRAHLLPWEGASFDVLAFVATVVLAALTASLVHRIVSRSLRIIVGQPADSLLGALVATGSFAILLLVALSFLRLLPFPALQRTLFEESVGRTDLTTGSFSDLARSIQEVLFGLPDDTLVFPGHMGETTIGHEKQFNYMV